MNKKNKKIQKPVVVTGFINQNWDSFWPSKSSHGQCTARPGRGKTTFPRAQTAAVFLVTYYECECPTYMYLTANK